MSWIITDEGRLLNLDHFTRLDWKEVKERNDTYYQVLAVRDFRHLNKEAVFVYRICNVDSELMAKDIIKDISAGVKMAWWAPEKEQGNEKY